MNDDDLIRRGDAAKICDDEAALYASKADAAAASVAAGETTNEPFFVACMLASIRLRAAAEEIRALPAVAREPEAAFSSLFGLPDDVRHRLVALARTDVFVNRMFNAIRGGMRESEAMAETIAGLASAQARLVAEAVDARAKSTQTVLIVPESPSPPKCATCEGHGVVEVWSHGFRCGPPKPCPDCAGGRRA